MEKRKRVFLRKSRSSSRVSSRARSAECSKTQEESAPPNTQVGSPKHTPSKHNSVLPFGKPKLHHKAATTRQRRPRQNSALPPVRRSLYEKRESDSSSSHSVQEALQHNKPKFIEKSNQNVGPPKRQEEDTSWIHRLEETATPASTNEEVDSSVGTASTAASASTTTASAVSDSRATADSVKKYERNIATVLKAFASMCETLTPELLRQQFYSLPQPDPREYIVSGDPSNAHKNRYSNIPCLDSSRILLEFLLIEGGGGYIHANRVTYPLLRNEFILTQGPLPKTISEFWRMIWQEKVETIIMLCRIVENGKRKCAEYFSNYLNIPLHCVNGHLTIFLRSRSQENDLLISTIELQYLSYSRIIIHYQWIEWPDCQAPSENAQTMFTILRRVRGSKTPVVVHCSAGVGRSGTLVALEMCLMTVANTRPIDIHSIVSSLRRCRALAVQSLDQYLSLYKLVLQFAQQNGCISSEEVEHFYRIMQAARQ